MRVVYRVASGAGWEGQCYLGLISRADGDRLPCPVRLCRYLSEADPRSRRSPGGPDLTSSSHPTFRVVSLPCSLTWVFHYELSTPALWWDMEAGFGQQGQDQDSRHALDQGRGCSPGLLCVCCFPFTGMCSDVREHAQPPQYAHAACACVHTCPICIDLSTWTLHTFRN